MVSEQSLFFPRSRFSISFLLILLVVGVMLVVPVSAVVPMGYVANNATNLSISTYDGSGQAMHPCVIYTGTAWNGYNYLMAMTPYPSANSTFENPSMRYSNDKINWEPMAGADDPIIARPGTGYNADPNIVLRDSTLYLFFRVTPPSGSPYVNYTTTTDGVAWTSQVKMSLPAANISPSFIYNGTGWEALAHYTASPYNLTHFYANSDLSASTTWISTGNVSGINIGSKTQWHSEAKIHDGEYQLLLVPTDYTGLYYFNSTDGQTWVASESNPVMLGYGGTNGALWDAKLYKTSFVERGGVFDVWYTGWTTANVHAVGYSKYDSNLQRSNLVTSASADGYLSRAVTNDTYPTIISGAGTAVTSTGGILSRILGTASETDRWVRNDRAVWMFDTSAIPDDAIIKTAALSIYPYHYTVNLDYLNFSVIGYTPATNGTLTIADYQTLIRNPVYSATLAANGLPNNQRVNIVLNAAGIANISKTAYTNLMLIQGYDLLNSSPNWLTGSKQCELTFYGAEDATRYPYLYLEYEISPVASFTANVTSGILPLGVAFTDTSTNTPTDWDWYINDVKFSDLQNPEYTFTEAGVYDVFLYAANGASGDWENKTALITVSNWFDLQCQNQTGNITLSLFFNSTTSLGWQWSDPVNITQIAEDGLFVTNFDNSSGSFIGTGYVPESWHKLKIYNETDFGQLNCTTDAVPVTPTPIPIMPSTESNVNPANLFQYWPYALLVLGIALMFKRF